jgi:hypothetical protein
VRTGLAEPEVKLVSKVLLRGCTCLKVFQGHEDQSSMIGRFVDIFTVLETTELADVFSLRVHALFQMMLEDEDLVEVASRLLSGQGAKDKNVRSISPAEMKCNLLKRKQEELVNVESSSRVGMKINLL